VSQPVPRLNGSLAQVKMLLAGRIRHWTAALARAEADDRCHGISAGCGHVGWQPASLAVGSGAATWLVLTAGRDLADGRRD